MGGSLRARGASESVILATLRTANAEQCQPPLDDAEVEAIAHSLARYAPASPGGNGYTPPEGEHPAHVAPLRLTDTTNAEFIAEMFGDCLRYDHRRGRFLIWGGHRWRPDADGQVFRSAIEAARERYRRATSIGDLRERGRVAHGR